MEKGILDSGLTIDTWMEILVYLETDDICSLSLVSKYMLNITNNDLLWQILLCRDFPGVKYENNPRNTYIQQLKINQKQKTTINVLISSAGTYQCMDFKRNKEPHLIGMIVRGELENIKKSLEPLYSEAIIELNAMQFYENWLYYGNYSETHTAYIARASEVVKYTGSGFSAIKIEDEHYVELNYEFFYKGPKEVPDYDYFFPFEGHVEGTSFSLEHSEKCKGTALHWACVAGHLLVVEYLCENYPGLDLNATIPAYDVTALDIAKTNGHWGIVHLLLKLGAKSNLK